MITHSFLNLKNIVHGFSAQGGVSKNLISVLIVVLIIRMKRKTLLKF